MQPYGYTNTHNILYFKEKEWIETTKMWLSPGDRFMGDF